MNKLRIGIIGYGTVGSGVVAILKSRKKYFEDKFKTSFVIKKLCDRSLGRKDTRGIPKSALTKKIDDVVNNPQIDVVIELIGGLKPALRIVRTSLKNGKHVITANKELIAHHGKELFQLAQKQNCHLYFESSVGAGIPVIKSITEGVAGNKIQAIYSIINGTCNFILSEMTKKNCKFTEALADAQKKGFAESNPRLDINGMDSAHKLAIMVYLAFGKNIKLKDIYVEGITHISQHDIENAEKLNLCIKLLAIAKKDGGAIEARVHPTLISKDHPLASINGVYNAVFLNANPFGDLLLSGEGAGQMAAASGVISDLINLASKGQGASLISNLFTEAKNLRIRKIDQIETKFYLRFMALDKPGVLSKITGLLGANGIGINSVKQNVHLRASTVPVIMLTDFTTEKKLRLALNKIQKLTIVKSKPVAIRMEKLW